MTYEGWSNYETWCVKLWLDNDEGTYHETKRMARAARDRTDLATDLKEMIEEAAPDLGGTLFGDLLGAAISEVDFYEIADAYLRDYADEDETDEGE